MRRMSIALLAMAAWAQTKPGEPAAGRLLVASRDLPDPNFAESVVLLTQHGRKGTMGLILNRQTRMRLAKFFREAPDAGRDDLVFSGGPVGREGAFLLFRAEKREKDSESVFGDVHLSVSLELLEKMVKTNADPQRMRVLVGYAGWGPGQLDYELSLGAWHVMPATEALVFDPKPDTLWERLIRRTESAIAGLRLSEDSGRRPLPATAR